MLEVPSSCSVCGSDLADSGTFSQVGGRWLCGVCTDAWITDAIVSGTLVLGSDGAYYSPDLFPGTASEEE